MESKYFNKSFCIEVAGDYACFTRPEMKVERVSYDVPTPSAARAVFDAIFWKPAIQWQVTKIEVLNPIKWSSVRRNEVRSIANERSEGLFIEENREQRASLLLRDVRYRLHADLVFIPLRKRPKSRKPQLEQPVNASGKDSSQGDENPGKYNAMFERRARKGQCFNQPYLGCREFSCSFRLIEDQSKEPQPISDTRDLGFMLYDMDFTNPDDPQAMFFQAKLVNGIVMVPSSDSKEIRK